VRKSLLAASAALLSALAVGAAAPAVRRWNHARRVDELLRTDPFFRTVVADTPSVREPLRAAMVAAYATGNPDAVFVAGNELLAPLLPAYVARSSDAAAAGFVRATVAGLTTLAARDPDECYRFLYPRAAGGGPTGRDAAFDAAMYQAVRSLVESSRSPRRAAASFDPAVMDPIYARLAARHGRHLAVLEEAQAPGVDRARVCRITLDLFADIAQLPEPQAAGALRNLMAAADATDEPGDR
jgi:hypothetical protein